MNYLGTSGKYVPRKSKREILSAVAKNAAIAESSGDLAYTIADSKMTERNTLEYRIRYAASGLEAIRVRLHSTDIFEIVFSKSGAPLKLKMESGGWKTKTTKERINNAIARLAPSRFYVSSDKGEWFVASGDHSTRCAFVDGAWFKPNGAPLRPSLHAIVSKRSLADDKLIREYIAKVKREGFPSIAESGGDPFVWPESNGKYRAAYVRDWLRTKYVFFKLIQNALLYAGVGPAYMAICCGLKDRDSRGKLDSRDLARLRRYLRACLGYAI